MDGPAPTRILLAPIAITPTKPLTPSHVKALLWLDTLYKATARVHDVAYLYNRVTAMRRCRPSVSGRIWTRSIQASITPTS